MSNFSAFDKILDIAEALIQTQGYNAFSFRDIAKAINIKTSSIHYHFPTKADLGKAVVQRHIDALCAHLDGIMKNPKMEYREKLNLFFDSVFTNTYLSNRKMCLGGMLASDVLTLPDTIQQEVRLFFNRIAEWLKSVLEEGKRKKEFRLEKE